MRHIKVKLSDRCRDNLRTHAIRLAAINPRPVYGSVLLPFKERRFTMSVFSARSDYATHNNCGSVGCSLGYATHTVEPLKRLGNGRFESYYDYARRVFGISSTTLDIGMLAAWKWMFSEEWYEVDNTAQGAAKRILYFLRNGVPYDWHDQMYGCAVECYTNVQIPIEEPLGEKA